MKYVVEMTFSSDRPDESWTSDDRVRATVIFNNMMKARKRFPDFASLTLRDEEGQTLGRIAVTR